MGGTIARTADLKWATGIFHTTEHHVQYINWGHFVERAALQLPQHLSAGSEQLHCATLLSLQFYLVFSPFSLLYFILFKFLNCSCLNPEVLLFFPDSPSHPTGGGEGEQASVWYLAARWG